MQRLCLDPDQLVGMNDYPPLHSSTALLDYYRSLRLGLEIKPVPIIERSIAVPYFKRFSERFSTYNKQLVDFFATHPNAQYFMLGGKHRSAAATILGLRTPGIILQSDADIVRINRTRQNGEVLGVGEDLEQTLAILEEHFSRTKRFWTMSEKTTAIIDNETGLCEMLQDIENYEL